MTKILNVLLYGQHIADLVQEDSGGKKLVYRPGFDSQWSLSVALPYRTEPYPNKPTMAFIEGLIPEGEATRQALQREFNLSSWKNPFLFLEKIGLDCAGAVQFVRPEDRGQPVLSQGGLHPLDDKEIGIRLRRLSESQTNSWIMPQEHWSLAGAQSKFALRRERDSWHEARGQEPTTHIIKPGISSLKDQALNEHLCLRTLRQLGLSAAYSEFHLFDGTPALVVERYDRLREQNSVIRLHQEDLCQAFSLLPEKKYESSGGPSAVAIVRLLSEVSSQLEVEKFIQGLIANYLLGAPDAHAKNYSLLHLFGNIVLAPLYDVASGFPYETLPDTGIPGRNDGLKRAAMRIGGENRFGRLERKHWEEFAKESGQDPDYVCDTVALIAQRLPQALREVCEDQSATTGDSPLPDRLIASVEHLCETTVNRLG